jgi:AcrR family transcriptional regulator
MVRNLSPEKREKYLSAALKLFVANGVHHTTTAAIAKEAGTAAGTLFLYFPTKQSLVDELVLQIGRQQSDYMKTLLDPSLPAREAFFTIWSGSVRWLLDHIQAYQYVQQVRDSGMISAAAVQESAMFFAYYYAAIQKGLAEGSVKPYPAEVIGGFLYQDIAAVMNLIRAQPDPDRVDEVIQQGFDIFWDGIKA